MHGGMNMAKLLNKWKKETRWGEPIRDYHWQNDDEPDYSWLKKIVAAGLIFAIVYIAHLSGTTIGKVVTDGVRYVLTVETDFAYLAERLAPYAPQGFDTMVLKRVQTTVSKPADPLLYMTRPVEGRVLSPYGWRIHPVLKQELMHEGIDFEVVPGTSVRAAAAGKVKNISDSAQLGKTVIVEHSQDVDSIYGHLGETLVKPGDLISQGQIIAKSGKTGMVSGPLLYFEVREKGIPIDPATRIKGELSVKEGK